MLQVTLPRLCAYRQQLRLAGFALAAIALLPAAARPQQPPSLNPDRPYLVPEANRLPDRNDQMQMHEQQAKKQSFQAANAERRRQLADDTAKLLQMATELKSEMDKTSKDTLSLDVMRKAGDIERLAKGIREKMKLSMGAS